MPRLIDADKLRKDILDLPNCYNGYSDTYDKACIIDMIDEQPTVEVVRCKDCIMYRKDKELAEAAYCDPEHYCALLRCEMGEDGYCSYGKRNCGKEKRC